jgi:16S rRNA (cytosine1402-N4)-methyltransferase
VTSFEHLPVLAQELVAGLGLQPRGYYLDATVGGGGHSQIILDALPDVRVLAIDRDGDALQASRDRLQNKFGERIRFWQGNFVDYPAKKSEFDGIIADLGVNSPQLDRQERGFSFRLDAPLDMRMDQSQALTAATVINHWKELDLANLFFEYGEERLSRRIARQIVQQRPFQSTLGLAEAIAKSVPGQYRHGRIHPATRVFQALRIAVNDELGSLDRFLARSPLWLKPGGRLGIITFHSLEDRRVKHGFRDSALLEVLTKKPIIPQPEELDQNRRSRSAKLRFAQRKAD